MGGQGGQLVPTQVELCERRHVAQHQRKLRQSVVGQTETPQLTEPSDKKEKRTNMLISQSENQIKKMQKAEEDGVNRNVCFTNTEELTL